MNAVNDNIGTPVARGLNVLIVVAMAFIAVSVILLVCFGIILTVSYTHLTLPTTPYV